MLGKNYEDFVGVKTVQKNSIWMNMKRIIILKKY